MRKRILLAEDSVTQAEALRSVLDSDGYDVTVAPDGEAALHLFEAGEYEVVITDVMMPGAVDGYELCRRVKAGPRRETPVVVLTSLSDPLDIIKGLESGADNFFTKPFDAEHLLDRLRVLLDTRSARRQARAVMGVKVMFLGREFSITSEREQILDLLISTFEDAVRQNRELRMREAELEAARAELARYASALETDLERFFELSVDMIAMSGMDGYMKRVNPAWERWLGWTEAELLRRPYIELVHPDERESVAGIVRGLRTAGLAPLEGQTRFRCKDGSYRSVEWRAIPVTEQDLVYVVARDVTERNVLEEQFRQAQKMESVGRLAGGVAHDFNNLLTVILGETELALADLGGDSPLREGLQEVKNAGQRGAALTRQLLAFSRQEIIEPRVFVINEAVEQMDKMLQRLIGDRIELLTMTAADLGATRVDPGQFEQVLMNLVVNARDAMPDGGQLTVETANVVLDEEYARRHANVKPGEYVMLAVSDTGIGMDAETRRHIFEPFYTTKEQGKGTGLGLATCYGIVKQANGHIHVYSEEGVGTTFKVYLPLVRDDADDVDFSALAQPQGGTETILVVEDEEAVRSLSTRILEAHGYRVFQAADAAAGLKILVESDLPIDLLFTDLMLPGMTGRALAERAREHRPGLRVLYASGYTSDVTVRNNLLERRDVMVHKPFTAEALLGKVREVLDATVEA